MMFQRAGQFIVLIFVHFSATSAQSDFTVLRSVKDVWKNTPPNWEGSDPCGGGWDGVNCTDSRVTSIILSSMHLTGELPDDIQLLTELQILDLSYNPGLTGPLSPQFGNLTKLTTLILIGCGFNGSIPGTIGSMTKLTFLALNSNSFTGSIPPSIGNLINLYWLDLADNKLSGTIPVSSAIEPGLDLLVNTKHFHFGENQLRGEIPAKLFNANMTLKHLLFENNWLTGRVPSTIGLVDSLEVVRLDRNLLSGEVPSSFNELNHVNELFLSNNNLSGSFPDLTGMSSLVYLDMNKTGLQGQLPPEFFSLPQLQTVVLANNQLNGTLDFGSTYSTQLQLVDMQSNRITDFLENGYTSDLILVGNPICTTVSGVRKRYCSLPTQSDASDSSPQDSCPHTLCISPDKLLSPTCKCAYPYTGSLNFRAFPFSDLGNSSIYTSLKNSLMDFTRSLNLPVDSVSLSVLTKIDNGYPFLTLNFFPSGQDRFTYTGVAVIAHMLSNNAYKPPDDFGPYVFKGDSYDYFADHSVAQKLSSHSGIIIGSVVGGCVLVLLLVIAGIYAYRQKGRAERADKRNSPFALWDLNKGSGDVPQLKGPRSFSFEELKKYTNGFSEANSIGAGGYGRVYKGTLPRGNLVAIKRAQQGSTQGCHEFKTEIELLSRVHHKNLVRLVGFCFDEGEQMLVYEYISNGTLKDNISGRTGIRLDWMRRLRITLGAARGLQYLHDLADPPIIHRDIKSNNILLDERLNAKVADFGLSKPMGDSDKTHLTTQVKGTLGYMDPEYYMTQQVTEKSDVYSFGVMMLEMITARSPIERGKFIVREVKQAMDKTKVLHNLQEIIDPIIGVSMQLKGLEMYVDVALKCVEETGSQRPSMSEVVKEIENIMESAGFNPNAESCTTSASYSDGGTGFEHPYNSNENLIAHSRSVY